MAQDDNRTGRLEEIPLPDLLRDLYNSKATGILAFLHRNSRKTLFLKEGHIVYAASNLEEDRLGSILVRRGKLTKDQVEEVLKTAKTANKKFGALVVEMGFLSPKKLFEGLKTQVNEIVYSLFQWDEGAFRFEPGILPEDIVPLSIDPIQLISEIIERLQKGSDPAG